MKVTYDSDTDTLRILLSDSQIDDSDEERPGIVLDCDKCGDVIGIEILDASRRMENQKALEFVVSG